MSWPDAFLGAVIALSAGAAAVAFFMMVGGKWDR